MDNGVPFAVTLEREWKNNARNISCIPAGFYFCSRYSSERYPDTFQVLDVTNRSGILFHAGNTEDDSAGCILVGESYDEIYGKDGIGQSRKGFNEFMRRLGDAPTFTLKIYEGVE